jgi:hypothetical protein
VEALPEHLLRKRIKKRPGLYRTGPRAGRAARAERRRGRRRAARTLQAAVDTRSRVLTGCDRLMLIAVRVAAYR